MSISHRRHLEHFVRSLYSLFMHRGEQVHDDLFNLVIQINITRHVRIEIASSVLQVAGDQNYEVFEKCDMAKFQGYFEVR